MSDFVTYTDRVVLPMTAGDAASYYFFIASTVGKMSSLISTPLNGVITGHLARYQGKITKKMLTGVFAALSALAVILIAGTTLGSHIYVYLFYREDYNVVKNLFLLANAGQVFFFMSNTMMTVVLRFAPERYQLIMGVIYAVLFFAAVVPAMYLYKIWGAVWGLLAAGIGSAMADLLGGYFVYVPITFAVKGLIALFAGLVYQKMATDKKKKYIAVLIGGVIDIVLVAGGYFVCEYFLYGASAASIPANIIQGVGGLVISIILYPILIAIPDINQMASPAKAQ